MKNRSSYFDPRVRQANTGKVSAKHFQDEIIFHIFKVYSSASDPTESLNREKVTKYCVKSNAKGLRLVPEL